MFEFGFGGLAGDLDEVSFFYAGGGLGEAVGQLAVVGDDEQAFAHVVEAADGVEALLHLVEELHHRGAAFGVLDGGDEAAGLVEDEVAVALGALEQLAVDADVVAGGVGLGAQHGDHLAVDLDAALLDHGLGAAAAGDAGGGEDFLQAFEFGWGTRLRERTLVRRLRLQVAIALAPGRSFPPGLKPVDFFGLYAGVKTPASLRNDDSLRG